MLKHLNSFNQVRSCIKSWFKKKKVFARHMLELQDSTFPEFHMYRPQNNSNKLESLMCIFYR